jgi:hypothetical protein
MVLKKKMKYPIDRTLVHPFRCPCCEGRAVGTDPVWDYYRYPEEDCVYCNASGVVGPFKWLYWQIFVKE